MFLIFNPAINIGLEHIGLPATDSVALKNCCERVVGARLFWESGGHPPAYLLSFPSGRVRFFSDPEGNLLHFVERAAEPELKRNLPPQ